jgi:hypothetical protein
VWRRQHKYSADSDGSGVEEGEEEREWAATSPPQDMSFESSGYSEPSTSTNMATVLESDTSADELAVDDGLMARRSDKRLKRGEGKRTYLEDRSGRRGRHMR